MDKSVISIIFILLGATALIVSIKIAYRLLTRSLKAPAHQTFTAYVRKQLLTESESKFFQTLLTIVPREYYIFAQVRLANLVKISNKTKFLWSLFAPIGMKSVDFVLYEIDTGKVALVIELDDSTHKQSRRQHRDHFLDQVLENASIPVLHVPVAIEYSHQQLQQTILQKIT